MPSREQIEKTMKTHFEAWNARDREHWLTIWREDVVIEDPVGGPEKNGIEAAKRSWEQSFQPGHEWTLEPICMQICEDQAALHIRNHGVVAGEPVELDSIEIYWVDDDGLLFKVRTYFSTPEGATLDPFFSKVT
ncbi:MAG: hypothetical protein CL908_22930 [Deltaproteobacteria bacterium]|jgi:ketosteroid isomerase-like protein|nr:hypothetical protein [Deltaproteobacteria bacterium]